MRQKDAMKEKEYGGPKEGEEYVHKIPFRRKNNSKRTQSWLFGVKVR